MKNDQIQHSINKEETVIAINGLYKSFGELNVLNGIVV